MRTSTINAQRNRREGYTLIEVLVVVTIIGLAGAIIVPQMLAAGTLGVQAAARMVISDILYAQNEAIAQQDDRSVAFDESNNRYQINDASGSPISASWQAGNSSSNYIIDLANDSRFSGVTLENVDFNGTNTLTFDALGAPSSGGTLELVFNGNRYRVAVAAFTGRVTVTQISP